MVANKGFIVLLSLVILVTGAFSMFQVAEWEKAMLFRLGEIVRDDMKPGLHFKFPFINNVRKFDGRVLTLDVEPERFLMIGNSLRSDVLPVVELGGAAIWIEYHTTWEHERVEPAEAAEKGYHTLGDIRELPDWLGLG